MAQKGEAPATGRATDMQNSGGARSKPVDEFAAANPKYAVAAEHADDGDEPDGQNKSDAAGSSLRLGKGPTQSAPLGESECFSKREGSKHRVATDGESERNNAATAACAIAVIRISRNRNKTAPTMFGAVWFLFSAVSTL